MESANSAVPVMSGSANDISRPFAASRPGAKQTPQQRERDDRLKLLYASLERAANSGVECPTNEALGRTLGYASPSRVSDLVALLEVMGFVTVERGRSTRVVTIVKTGKRTAGIVLSKRSPGGWTDDRDAILMDGIAEGLTFDAIGKILRKSKNSCISRFHTLAAKIGPQAQ